MSNFDDVVIEWKGTKYTIKKNRVLGAIARIEDVVTMSELQRFWDRGTAPMAKIAMAYGTVLRYVGVQVTDDEVYAGMFSTEEGESTSAEDVVSSVSALIEMMVPPVARKALKDKVDEEDKQEKSLVADKQVL